MNHLAVAYVIEAGFSLVAIPHGLKGPRMRGWQTEQATVRTEQQAACLTGNIGIAHRWSGTCALDVDQYQLAQRWFAVHAVDLQQLLTADDAVQIRSGRPNRAKLLYRLPAGVTWLPTIKPDGCGVELRCATSDGTATVQDVLPPSIHPVTARPYEWAGLGDWRNLPLLPVSVRTLWQTPRPLVRGHSIALPAGAVGARVDAWLAMMREIERHGLYLVASSPGWHRIVCPWAFTHSDNDPTGAAISEPAESNRWAGGFRCHHAHCAKRAVADVYRWARAARFVA